MPRILLIDDDEHLGPPLAAYLARSGIELEQATRPSLGLARLRAGGFDAAILDVMLPEMDGFELCRTIRRDSALPLLMLTARGDVMDRVVGLELGADDYLPKPFAPRELLARLGSLLRRAKATAAPTTPTAHAGIAGAPAAGQARVLRFDDGLSIDLDRRETQNAGRPIDLTGAEFDLLALLAGTPGKVFSRDDILERLRGHAAEDIHTRAIDILISRLRRKLEPLDPIKTLRNAGYRFGGVLQRDDTRQ